MALPFLILSQSDHLIQVVDTNSNTEWQTVQIQISWLLKKPTDLNLQCLQRQSISGVTRTRDNLHCLGEWIHFEGNNSDVQMFPLFSMGVTLDWELLLKERICFFWVIHSFKSSSHFWILRRQLSVCRSYLPLQNVGKLFQVYPFTLGEQNWRDDSWFSTAFYTWTRIHISRFGESKIFWTHCQTISSAQTVPCCKFL